MDEQFLWYDWHGRWVAELPMRDCGKVIMTSSNTLGDWCFRVFPAVDAHMYRPAELTVKAAQREANDW